MSAVAVDSRTGVTPATGLAAVIVTAASAPLAHLTTVGETAMAETAAASVPTAAASTPTAREMFTSRVVGFAASGPPTRP